MEPRLAPKHMLQYPMLSWQQLHQLMIWSRQIFFYRHGDHDGLSSCPGLKTKNKFLGSFIFSTFNCLMSKLEGKATVLYVIKLKQISAV